MAKRPKIFDVNLQTVVASPIFAIKLIAPFPRTNYMYLKTLSDIAR